MVCGGVGNGQMRPALGRWGVGSGHDPGTKKPHPFGWGVLCVVVSVLAESVFGNGFL